MTLLADPVAFDYADSYRRLPEHFYSRVRPTPPVSPFLIHFNREAAKLIDLPADLSPSQLTRWFSGQERLPDAGDALSTVYAGHQFGSYVPQLGDGRAHLLAQLRNRQGELWEIQLKGSGQTPYSRFGDGRAVLRSTIREYLCSEAMAALGIPTTRALCMIGSEEPVQRETVEKAAVLTRLAPSFVRFGHFEWFAHSLGDDDSVRRLADYVIELYYPSLASHDNRHAAWLSEIVRRTAELIAQWQAVGFAHGVMNTDNMSILGLTLDYGPFGFLDAFDPGYICNHSDHGGRYAFDQQAPVAWWNLHALAHALQSLLPIEQSREIVASFWPVFTERYRTLMQAKIGLERRLDGDDTLLADLLALMAEQRVDYTRFFRALCDAEFDDAPLLSLFKETARIEQWLARYRQRVQQEAATPDQRWEAMKSRNPKYILRNYLAEQAIRQASFAQDYTEIDRLLRLLQRPFDEQPEMEQYAAAPPDWAGALCISCSS